MQRLFIKDESCEIKNNPTLEFKPISMERVELQIEEAATKKRAIPLQLRFDVFKSILASHSDAPEKVPSSIVRRFFDYDLTFVIQNLKTWKDKKELAEKALQNIDEFFSTIDIPREMSFFQHSYYCFCISALITGLDPKDIDKEYDKSLKTMIYGVVHPVGKWTIKTELENQNFSKYIAHVSKSGLATIDEINHMTTFRLNKKSPFHGVRMLAIACGEKVEFDGVKEMEVDCKKRDVRSLEVLKHDFIHAGFMRRHYEKDPVDFNKRFQQLGTIFESICEDKELQIESKQELRQLVKAAWFFWLHEFTTSIYVDGIPDKLPKKHLRTHGKYANEPQIVLKGATKLHYLPDLFENEIEVELKIFQHLGIPLKALESAGNEHKESKAEFKKLRAAVAEMINKLHYGYEYLDTRFSHDFDLKKTKYWLWQTIKREFHANLGSFAGNSPSL